MADLSKLNGFTFNSVRKNYILTISKKRPYWAPVKRNFISIPGMPGCFMDSTETEVRVIPVDVNISADSPDELMSISEDFAAWLITDKPKELIFDDEPGRIYYAVVDGSFDPEEIVSEGFGKINFICADPYKYGPEKQANFQSSGTVIVNGSAETHPKIKVNITQDTTFVAVGNGEKINLIGNPARQEETPYQPETAVYATTCNTLTGWTNSSSASIEGAEQTGVLKTNGDDFYTDDYGTAPGWHGPAMKTSLGAAVQDFRFDVGLSMVKTGANQAGCIEVALLDASSRIIGKIAITKHHGGLDTKSISVKVGNTYVIKEGWADYDFDFGGIIRVYRRGKVWTAQVFLQTIDGFLSPVTHTWTDNDGIASAPVTQVQARVEQRADFPVVQQKIDDINVYKLNIASAGQIPIIAKAGDVIEFDHADDIIRRNGEDITKEKAFIGEYFPLKKGLNTIVAEPANSISNVEVGWRDRWL